MSTPQLKTARYSAHGAVHLPPVQTPSNHIQSSVHPAAHVVDPAQERAFYDSFIRSHPATIKLSWEEWLFHKQQEAIRANASWHCLTPLQQAQWLKLHQEHHALHNDQNVHLATEGARTTHAQFTPTPSAILLHHHHQEAMNQRTAATAHQMLGKSATHLPAEPSHDLPIFPNIHHYEYPLQVVMPSQDLQGHTFLIVGGSIAAFYAAALLLGAGARVHIVRKYDTYKTEGIREKPLFASGRNRLLSIHWPALLRYAQVGTKTHPQYFMDLLFGQTFALGETNKSTTEGTDHYAYRVCEKAIADIVINHYQGSDRLKVMPELDLARLKAYSDIHGCTAWIVADGNHGAISSALSPRQTSQNLTVCWTQATKTRLDQAKLWLALAAEQENTANPSDGLGSVNDDPRKNPAMQFRSEIDIGADDVAARRVWGKEDEFRSFPGDSVSVDALIKVGSRRKEEEAIKAAREVVSQNLLPVLRTGKKVALSGEIDKVQITLEDAGRSICPRPPLPSVASKHPPVFFLGDACYQTSLPSHFRAIYDCYDHLRTKNILVSILKWRIYEQIAKERKAANSDLGSEEYCDRCYRVTEKLRHLLPEAMKTIQAYLKKDITESAEELFQDAMTCRRVVDKELDGLDKDGLSFRKKVMEIIEEPDAGDRLAHGYGLFALFEKRQPRKKS